MTGDKRGAPAILTLPLHGPRPAIAHQQLATAWRRGNSSKLTVQEASFALKPGEMSDIVETDSGVHVILRTA